MSHENNYQAGKMTKEQQQAQCPWRTIVWDDYSGIDEGIRFAVRVLHAAGIETCQSCQGGEGHAYDEPTVELRASQCSSEGFAALAALRSFGLPVNAVALHWPVYDGLPYEKNWRITFSTTMEARADDKLMFVSGCQAQV